MKYQEQFIAEDFYKSLQAHFKTSLIEILVNGIGVHWNCRIMLDIRECKIHSGRANIPQTTPMSGFY
jgi:hypothetical protein